MSVARRPLPRESDFAVSTDHRLTAVGSRELLPCRQFVDEPTDGAWNMAVDEALLEQAADEGLASLRFYQWNEPTLSLGYFQRYADRQEHVASRAAPIVRRLSGGGALLHDRELTYSLTLPAAHPLSRQSTILYRLVHLEVIAVLAGFGIRARLHDDPAASPLAPAAGEEPFLCFARRAPVDVVVDLTEGSQKIVGSAQRRRRGAVLQHGAVLLDSSPFAPELPGLRGEGRGRISPIELLRPWSERLAERLHLRPQPAGFHDDFALQLRKRLVTKHASDTWIKRR